VRDKIDEFGRLRIRETSNDKVLEQFFCIVAIRNIMDIRTLMDLITSSTTELYTRF